jgi:hypothetical protein
MLPGPSPTHESEYSVAEQASLHCAGAPSGETTAPSASIVDPFGTSQISNSDRGRHPAPEASEYVSAAAGHEHAGMVSPAPWWVDDASSVVFPAHAATESSTAEPAKTSALATRDLIRRVCRNGAGMQ